MVRDMLPAIEAKAGGEWRYELQNFNRSIGARISGEIARRWGNYGMEDAPLTVRCSGNAGQSFGVWNAGGLHLYLEGDANDYVGKGMAAGRIVLRHPRARALRGERHRHHGQHLPVRCHRRRAVCRRGRRRALRGAQLRRGGGDRRRGRSLLRVHDRRRGVRARAHRGQLRRRLHRRLRLRAGPGAQLRRSLQPRAHRHQPHLTRRRCSRTCSTWRGCSSGT